jgi:hypothetical protein
MRVQLESSS